MEITNLKKLLNKHRKRLGLQSWPIEIIIIEDKVGLTKGKELTFKDYSNFAETQAKDEKKRSFTLYFTKESINSPKLEEIIIHELLHALFWKLILIAGEEKENTAKVDKEEHFIIDKLLKALMN